MTKTYHSKVYMPGALKAIAANLYFQSLIWSKHAQSELLRDKYGIIADKLLPRYIAGAEWELVEVETMLSGRPVKYVFRRPIDSLRALVVVVCPDAMDVGFVKTCWVNENTDKHRTLDRTKYANS